MARSCAERQETRLKAVTLGQVFEEYLQAVLPPGCRPILVIDAGFKTPWFQAVEALGWNWVSHRGLTEAQIMEVLGVGRTAIWRTRGQRI